MQEWVGESHAARPAPRAGAALGERRRRLAGLRDAFALLGLAVALALLVRTFVVEPFRIPSESMLPTLVVGDHLFVDKLAYGARLPFSARRLPAVRDPARGEVVVFHVGRREEAVAPADRRPDWDRERFVKRIVGLPGDRVELRGGALFVNGVAAGAEGALPAGPGGVVGITERLGERDYATLRRPAEAALLADLDVRVEPGRYFVMGDNREQSNDSRRFGTIRREEIEGPAFVLYWSLAGAPGRGAASAMALLPERIRWDRIGARIR